ncbi:hypothetical protein SDRG_00852 [Saprolegnia diclina VS20]|uniref:Uncharacterized protein n=1 Tax=Saprolegnia diclina (strain VS20) TaxID=1156394 RepID=T0R6D7_SAPDV|nr:hypothetical protein SDRG_00852 [Saprolegnia diclina VS20]EQC42005.1 hypothetical protein SDRG_00852 [Saprolegnia diclina VS20]|eukprot:XP_008604575.1 hypothetical protein SDRG_00852 [Saprolegnia diclina VS20]
MPNFLLLDLTAVPDHARDRLREAGLTIIPLMPHGEGVALRKGMFKHPFRGATARERAHLKLLGRCHCHLETIAVGGGLLTRLTGTSKQGTYVDRVLLQLGDTHILSEGERVVLLGHRPFELAYIFRSIPDNVFYNVSRSDPATMQSYDVNALMAATWPYARSCLVGLTKDMHDTAMA